MLVRWKKVERGWQRAHQQDFEIRQLSLPDDLIQGARVVAPGGRWLLLFSADLSVSYFDLTIRDMEAASAFPLIPRHNSFGATFLHVSDPDVDQASPVLSFRIAVAYIAGNNATGRLSFIEIWNITSMYDGNAEALNAQKVAIFQLDLACALLDIYSLTGDSMLFAAPYTHTLELGHHQWRFMHFNWRKALNNPHQPCCRTVLVPAMVRGLFFASALS